MAQNLSSNAKKMEAVRLMLEGMDAHKEELVAAGISGEFIQKMSEQMVAVEKAEADQERQKARKLLSTEFLMTEMDKLMKFYKRARKIIKNDTPQGGWLEFGIAAKR